MSDRFRFLLDESTLRPPIGTNASASDLGAALEHLVDRIQDVQPHTIAKFSHLWYEPIGSYPLCDWLFNPDLGIDPVVAEAIRMALSRMPDWDNVWSMSELPSMVDIAGQPREAISVSAAARETCAGRATGCLSARPSHSGLLHVVTDQYVNHLHFIGEKGDVLKFFRDVPEVEDLDEDSYFQNAKFAFPNVIFARDQTRFGNFDESYKTIRSKVTLHLSVISDHARNILTAAEPAGIKETRFGSHGVEASGESAQTKADQRAIRQREVRVVGQSVLCDWHTKIRRHIDRIYFNATSLKLVVVGVFRDHLD